MKIPMAKAIVVLVLCGCERSTAVDGVQVTQSQCRDDLHNLEISIDRVLAIGKVAARDGWDSDQIYREVLVESSRAAIEPNSTATIPDYRIGPCGKKAGLAFNQFVQSFSYALGMENESDYAPRPASDKEKLKTYAMKHLKESQANLEQERQALRKLVRGN